MLKTLIILLSLSIPLMNCGSDSEPVSTPTPYNLDLPFYFNENFEFPFDNPLTVEGVKLGRLLFYEKKLSRDNSISCSSCHQQDKAFTDGLAFSNGIDGQKTTLSAMTLVNMPWSSHFFWDGRASSLEQQALEPIENSVEMDQPLEDTINKLQSTPIYADLFLKAFGNSTISAENIGKALAQFQRTLISSDSRYDQFLLGKIELSEQEKLGMDLFFTHPEPSFTPPLRGGNCGDCHVNILTSGVNDGFQGFKNNGLDNDDGLEESLAAVTGLPSDRGKFKIPSLRNIALTAPYMHDGRFANLDEVLDHYNEHVKRSETLDPLILEASNERNNIEIKLHLTVEEKAAIIAFLHTLTDNEFINNEAFSDPF